jgi:carbonic anhydrase/acetyltransferase-like protein (isoleucine patch superfamily)
VVARSGSVVGAGAVVPNGMELPVGAMALGVPARVKPDAVRRDFTTATSALYVDNARRYALELRRLS